MKKINNLYLIIMIAGATIMGSCKKSYLEQTPNDSLTPEQALKDESGLTSAVNGAYAGLEHRVYGGFIWKRFSYIRRPDG